MKNPLRFEWETTEKHIACRSNNVISFNDSLDHWRNALCRLLNLDESSVRKWVETVIKAAHDLFNKPWPECTVSQQAAALKAGSRSFYGLRGEASVWDRRSCASISILGESVDRLWAEGIGRDHSVALVGSDLLKHGILVKAAGETQVRVTPAVYEEVYFEGRASGYGYGDCLDQSGWRMEKSTRQVRQIKGIADYLGRPTGENTHLLDVGSGYGYFRNAAAEMGWTHEGVDISRHAANTASVQFGFTTFVGTLEDFKKQATKQYDIITLFDTLEHAEDPQSFLKCVTSLLSEGGCCVIRTPNLLSLEMDVFGPYYHSLKMEHLHYFSATSLCYFLQSVGLTPVFLTTESHLLQGFLGRQVSSYERLLWGSDLFAIAQNKPNDIHG